MSAKAFMLWVRVWWELVTHGLCWREVIGTYGTHQTNEKKSRYTSRGQQGQQLGHRGL